MKPIWRDMQMGLDGDRGKDEVKGKDEGGR